MTIPVDQLVSCMTWAAQQNLAEVTLTIGRDQVTILRGVRAGDTAPAPAAPAPALTDSAAPAPASGTVTASLAGLCHLAPEPGGARFAALGDHVVAGQTLCLLEAMKMMTPITADHPGTVEEIFIEDGATVAAGTPLMRIAP